MGYLNGIRAKVQHVTCDGTVFSRLVVTGRESRPLPPYYAIDTCHVPVQKEPEPPGITGKCHVSEYTAACDLKIGKANLFVGQNASGMHKPWRWSY
jgi:hypothetical protein